MASEPAKREAILNAAVKLFTENGFHGTPTARIAREAGVATGTLFHYFKTKEELINQLYLEVKQDLAAYLKAELMREPSLRAKCRRIWVRFIEWNLKYPDKMRFFLQFCNSPYISHLTHEEANQHLKFFYDLIEDGKKRKIVKNAPNDVLFDLATGILQASGTHFLFFPDKFKEESYREMMFKAYWDCLKR